MMTELPAKRADMAPAPDDFVQRNADDLVRQMQIIEEVKSRVMVKNVDYGIIPGCQKPSLLQPGAEKLCAVFRLAQRYTFACEWEPDRTRHWTKKTWNQKTRQYDEREGDTTGFVRYGCECELYTPQNTFVGSGTGVANNFEPKFISRDPYEIEETIKQFARKRALVNAARTATAASSIFTQDIEDQEGFQANAKTDPPPPPTEPSDDQAPVCEKCNLPMTLRTSTTGEFWGCVNYPTCRFTVNKDTARAKTDKPKAKPKKKDDFDRTKAIEHLIQARELMGDDFAKAKTTLLIGDVPLDKMTDDQLRAMNKELNRLANGG